MLSVFPLSYLKIVDFLFVSEELNFVFYNSKVFSFIEPDPFPLLKCLTRPTKLKNYLSGALQHGTKDTARSLVMLKAFVCLSMYLCKSVCQCNWPVCSLEVHHASAGIQCLLVNLGSISMV